MPLQNRVTPWGEIVADSARGAWMGNRGGAIHDNERRLGARRWASKHWLVCRLEFNGRRREVMSPGRYTELFFLDEATALAAGHRPCFECRRQEAEQFRRCWADGRPGLLAGETPALSGIDTVLHAERVDRKRDKLVFPASIADLPDGTFVLMPPPQPGACLVLGGSLWPWSFAGYGVPFTPDGQVLSVLTPRSTVAAIRSGYSPQVHASARL
jgi:hypothetical protein